MQKQSFRFKGGVITRKKIKKLLPIVSIILLMLGFFNIIDSDVAFSIAVLITGVSAILNGYSSYLKNKKRESISLILTGFIIIILSILSLFLRNLLNVIEHLAFMNNLKV